MSKKNELSNFISLCKHVYLLSEHDSIISHDIPFKEAYSGSIDIVLKSENPIYIRNHYVDGDDSYENKDNVKISTEFCHYEGTPYIPATSIKGMIRSVLEILSYSKLGNKIDEAYLSRIENNSLFEKHLSEKLDLSEAIFGTTDLKGRVIFSHLLAEEYTQEEVISTILMSPVAKENKIGWKRYPMESDVQPNTKNKKDTIITKFKPLSNATFSGKIVFHNLRDYELGALLSALTFHKTDGAYHLIGMAKSQKYAKIKLAITLKSEKNLDTFLKAYEKKINSEIIFDNDKFWNESRYIKRLIERHSSKDKISMLLSKEEIEIIKNNKLKKEKYEQDLINVLKSNNPQILQNFIDKNPEYEKLGKVKLDLQK